MIYTREQIEQLPAGRELDEVVDFYLNHSNPTNLPFTNYDAPISSKFFFEGQGFTFYGTPPFSENERLAEHVVAKHNPDYNVEQLPSGNYHVTLLTSAGNPRLSPVVANTKALALCRAGLIGKMSSV